MIVIIIGTILGMAAFDGLALIDFAKGMMAMNIAFVIPAGGFIVGMGIGAIQAYMCFLMNQPVKKPMIALACFGAALAYLSTDATRYFVDTIRVTTDMTHKLAPGIYPIRKFFSFWTYMKLVLSSSSYEDHGRKFMELGALWTRFYYAANLLGAMLGAFASLRIFIDRYPLCAPCQKYLRHLHTISRYFTTNETITTFIKQVQDAVKKPDGNQMQELYINESNPTKPTKEHGFKTTLEARGCPDCGSALLLSTTQSRRGNNWQNMDPLKTFLLTQTSAIVMGAKKIA